METNANIENINSGVKAVLPSCIAFWEPMKNFFSCALNCASTMDAITANVNSKIAMDDARSSLDSNAGVKLHFP